MGLFLPLLPTTPFLLLASACYVRGSERMHRWLLGHRILGPYLIGIQTGRGIPLRAKIIRSEEHTSELQSLMRISYAVFCLKKQKKYTTKTTIQPKNRTCTN